MSVESKQNNIVWLQLSAGHGPRECGWVVAQLYKRLLEDALKNSVSVDLVEKLPFDKLLKYQDMIEADAYRSVLIRFEGLGVEAYVEGWTGAIKWQGESPYRIGCKRRNWFVGIERVSMARMSAADVSELAKEVEVTAIRSGGPGGQHVNKTNSAVRLTHRPTGLKVRVDSDRSQHKNRRLAMERLQLTLAEKDQVEDSSQVHNRWLKHNQVQRGNPVRVFWGPEFRERD